MTRKDIVVNVFFFVIFLFCFYLGLLFLKTKLKVHVLVDVHLLVTHGYTIRKHAFGEWVFGANQWRGFFLLIFILFSFSFLFLKFICLLGWYFWTLNLYFLIFTLRLFICFGSFRFCLWQSKLGFTFGWLANDAFVFFNF